MKPKENAPSKLELLWIFAIVFLVVFVAIASCIASAMPK